MPSYYNEIDPYCVQWLKNLIAAKLIPAGEVDDRSIEVVQPDDLKGFSQCHFFAGIGGWAYALELAGWPEDREVWTGSCPCQPFSTAGKQKAQTDTRHLWPVWFSLIQKCGPSVIFGEQVEAAITKGWLDEIANDVEREEYAFASGVLPACSVTAPHRRNRLWFVADAAGKRRVGKSILLRPEKDRRVSASEVHETAGGRIVGNPNGTGLQGRVVLPQCTNKRVTWTTSLEWWQGQDGKYRPIESGILPLANGVPGRVGKLRAAGNAIVPQVAAEVIKAWMEVSA